MIRNFMKNSDILALCLRRFVLSKPSTIAIDGPAGSGKSTISQQLAERFGYTFIDTGAFYRAITYLVLKAGITLDDPNAVAALITQIRLVMRRNANTSDFVILAINEDVSAHLRSKQVENAVSIIAKMPIVRAMLLPLQRQ